MIFIRLFIEFFKTGLFAIGGGLATLPFLYEISARTGWYTVADIANLVAVSESTPGPMGINMATYVGYTTAGIPGSLIAPLGLITPSVVIIIIISGFLKKFKDSRLVQNAFYGLRAASTALIFAALISIARLAFLSQDNSSVHWIAVAISAAVFVTFRKFKKHPIIYLVIAGILGVVFSL